MEPGPRCKEIPSHWDNLNGLKLALLAYNVSTPHNWIWGQFSYFMRRGPRNIELNRTYLKTCTLLKNSWVELEKGEKQFLCNEVKLDFHWLFFLIFLAVVRARVARRPWAWAWTWFLLLFFSSYRVLWRPMIACNHLNAAFLALLSYCEFSIRFWGLRIRRQFSLHKILDQSFLNDEKSDHV